MSALARAAAPPTSLAERVAAIDWPRIAEELDTQGNAVAPGLLARAECDALDAADRQESMDAPSTSQRLRGFPPVRAALRSGLDIALVDAGFMQ